MSFYPDYKLQDSCEMFAGSCRWAESEQLQVADLLHCTFHKKTILLARVCHLIEL